MTRGAIYTCSHVPLQNREKPANIDQIRLLADELGRAELLDIRALG